MNDKMDVCMLDQVSNHEKSLDKMLIKKIEEEKHTPFNLQRERERKPLVQHVRVRRGSKRKEVDVLVGFLTQMDSFLGSNK